MKYNFDEIIDRRNTNCTSIEGFRQYIFHDPELKLPYKDEELIRMWIADMEFATPECIVEGIRRRLDRRIFGYTRLFSPGYYGVFSAWTEKMYGWTFPRGDLYICGGIIPALNELVGYACRSGDKVLIFTPSYTPFKAAADFHGLETVCSDLTDRAHNGYFEIDFDDFRAKAAAPAVKLLIFCNPHNPTGRIWTEEELRAVGEICMENDVLIISDEIHCDLLRSGRTHTPLAKLFPGTDRIITCMAPSKTFNLAGMFTSEIIIPNPELRARYKNFLNDTVHIYGNLFGSVAAQAAYIHGADWLDQLRDYLTDNVAYCKRFIAEQLPELRTYRHEATYLLWVNFQGLGLSHQELTERLVRDAHLGLNDGQTFGDAGEQCMRVNLACPRSTVEEAMQRLLKVKK